MACPYCGKVHYPPCDYRGQQTLKGGVALDRSPRDEGPFLQQPLLDHVASAHRQCRYHGRKMIAGWSAACPLCQACKAYVNRITRVDAPWLPTEQAR